MVEIMQSTEDPTDEDWVGLKILVIGAGGLGCELLKDLALSGFRNMHVIDMDTIDVSNLNRQFLFRMGDVGKGKAECAAAFVNKRVTTANITPHNCPIESIEKEHPGFYEQFNLIVLGLDSVVARRWINNKVHKLLGVDEDGDPEGMIPLIDGGTEAFKGSARVIMPGVCPCLPLPQRAVAHFMGHSLPFLATSSLTPICLPTPFTSSLLSTLGQSACIECTLDLFPPQVAFPMCTIATRPRLPEHCIAWAKQVLWPKPPAEGGREGDDLDGDDPTHIKWLFDKASARAAEYSITGVTYRLTQGVVKNIIPAVASTNAVIAAACTHEALKLATGCAPSLNNYMMFNCGEGVYNMVTEQERKENCAVCSAKAVPFACAADWTLETLFDKLKTDISFQMKDPGAVTENPTTGKPQTLYMKFMHAQTEANLSKTLAELGCIDGQTLHLQDPNGPIDIILKFA
jgi:ubiquitin-activating enzyme E1 C